MDEQNPVLLQFSGKWHIVEHSRRSDHTLCGQTVLAKLSDTFEVDVTATKSIIVANWHKNW
jgi:hypothetical protein